MRVKVWKFVKESDPNAGYLGEGEFLGHVPMSEVYSEEEYRKLQTVFLKSMGCSDEQIEGVLHTTLHPYSEQTTPKIRLDSGKIVYGCQIYWHPIVESVRKSKEV